MKKLFINLESSVDRRNKFESTHNGLTRVVAVEPTTMPKTVSKFHNYMSDTEVCCFLSHLECWKIIAESNSEYGLVCEDDVMIQFEPEALITSKVDFIHINNELSYAKPNKTTECSWKDLNRKSTSCYIISKELCKQLVEQFKETSMAYIADIFSDYMPNTRVVSINTNLFKYTEDSYKSTVEIGIFSHMKKIFKESGCKLHIVG